MPAKPLDQVTLGELIAQARDAAKDQCVVHPALTALNERLSQLGAYDESVNAVTVRITLSDIPDDTGEYSAIQSQGTRGGLPSLPGFGFGMSFGRTTSISSLFVAACKFGLRVTLEVNEIMLSTLLNAVSSGHIVFAEGQRVEKILRLRT